MFRARHSRHHRREAYTGEWLPEPLFRAPDAEQQAITHSRLSAGLLYLLEKLEPEQRVVFVLREVFDIRTLRSPTFSAGRKQPAGS